MKTTSHPLTVLVFTISSYVCAQQIGKVPEVHPKLTTQTCTRYGCVTHDTSVVLDALTHPINDIHTGQSCLNSSGGLDHAICPTVKKCAKNCALEGVNYAQHGVQTNGDSMTLQMYLPNGTGLIDVSPRVYLLDESGKDYSMLKLLDQEVSFEVDVSNLPCGMNGALYLSSMEASGGRSSLNPAGATYGTGYCDAQCFNTSAFINGVANVHTLGACCMEMDLWEANARATQLTPHPCNVTGFYECSGAACGSDGVCDKSGCGFNPYGLGAHKYYGPHGKVDTIRPFRVVTQFLTHRSQRLREIRRLYVQNGKLIHNAAVKFDNKTIDSITSSFCKADDPTSAQVGGLTGMDVALEQGMVLIFSIWNDASAFMNWLDSGTAGPCSSTEGNPKIIEKNDPGTSATFSAIRWGDIGTTYECEGKQ